MSLLFSSHLLPDVEAVCEYVMVLGRGRLLAQGRIDELKQPHELEFELRVKGDPVRFCRPPGGAGDRGRADRRPSPGAAPARVSRAARLGNRRATPANRSARFDRGGARSKKSSSAPWRKNTDADLRPGIPALARQALRPGRPLAADHPARGPRPAQEPLGPLGLILGGLPARAVLTFPGHLGDCSSRSPAS